MRLPNTRLFTIVTSLFLSTVCLPAAEIGLSGTDPTILLPNNPPDFAFTVDSSGFFTSQYINTSGFTFLNLIVTGPADGISTVGCSPDSVFAACSATIDTSKDLVTFQFSGGSGIANNQPFFLTAQDFPADRMLSGTSTDVVGAPEPASIFMILAGLLVTALLTRRRQLLKFRVAGE